MNSIRDFQRITQVDTQWITTYAPYFKFPSFSKKTFPSNAKISSPPIDLNRATVKQLQQINGIGKVLSARILRYRKRLRGFANEAQLGEVYGLTPEVVKRLQLRCSIITLPSYAKISLQGASLDSLAKLPYLSYQEARKIIRLRTEMGEIRLANLHSIKGFDSLKIKRLALYLF